MVLRRAINLTDTGLAWPEFIQCGWRWSYCSIRSAAGLLQSSGGAPNGGGVIFNLVVGSREEAELQAHSMINDWLRRHPRKHSVVE